MPSNKDLIKMHLEMFIRENTWSENWHSLLGFCLGYYGEITMDHLTAVLELQREGKVK